MSFDNILAHSSAGRKMRLLKLDALQKGEFTDFAFLVGQDKNEAEVSPKIFLICRLTIEL